jgi:hypothetical protein
MYDAGGVLTGKWKYDDAPQSGRFNVNTVWGKRYRYYPIVARMPYLYRLACSNELLK